MTMHYLKVTNSVYGPYLLFFQATDGGAGPIEVARSIVNLSLGSVASYEVGEVSAESLDWMMKQLESDAKRRDELMRRFGAILEGMDPDKVMRWARMAEASREQFRRGAMPSLYAHHPGGVYKTANDEANADLLKRLGARVREGEDGQLEFGLPPGQFKFESLDPSDGPTPETT